MKNITKFSFKRLYLFPKDLSSHDLASSLITKKYAYIFSIFLNKSNAPINISIIGFNFKITEKTLLFWLL